MSAQVYTSTEGADDSFNFQQWIDDNNLSEIKQLLIKHKVTNTAALSFTSKAFQALMADPELYQTPHMIPIITNAIKNDDSYIIVAEEEHTVMDSIKKNLKKLEQIEQEINGLKQTYPKSAQNRENIILSQTNKTKQKINEIFNTISNAVEEKRNVLLNELANVTSDLSTQTEAKDDENKEMDMISNSTAKIQTQNEYLTKKLKICKNMIKSTKANENRTKRKQSMIQIGDEIKDTFEKTERELSKNTEFIKNIIYSNNNYKTNVDFKFSESKYQKILQKMNDFGAIQNNANINELMADQDEVVIKQLKSELTEAKKEIATLENSVLRKDQQMAQNLALLNVALTSRSKHCEWECDQKEGVKPVLCVSKSPIVVRLLNGEFRVPKNKKKNPGIKSIEQICKCVMSLWEGTAARLKEGAIKSGVTHGLCGQKQTDQKFIGFQCRQQTIQIKMEKILSYWETLYGKSENDEPDVYNLSQVKLVTASEYKIYTLKQERDRFEKYYKDLKKNSQ